MVSCFWLLALPTTAINGPIYIARRDLPPLLRLLSVPWGVVRHRNQRGVFQSLGGKSSLSGERVGPWRE